MHKQRKKEKNRMNHRSERMLHDAQTVSLPASRHSAVMYGCHALCLRGNTRLSRVDGQSEK